MHNDTAKTCTFLHTYRYACLYNAPVQLACLITVICMHMYLLSQFTSWFDLSQFITVGFDLDVGY